MARTGFAQLPLHNGRAPRYLFGRMVPLSREIIIFSSQRFGRAEALRRLSDSYWFQAFGCVLGFDWHSSGLTTTVCGAVKEGLRGPERELGIYVAGGKGAAARKTPAEITASCDRLGRNPACWSTPAGCRRKSITRLCRRLSALSPRVLFHQRRQPVHGAARNER